MTDPLVAFALVMDAIAQGVMDGIRAWALTVVMTFVAIISLALLYARHVRREDK